MDKEEVAGLLQPEPRGVDCQVDSSDAQPTAPEDTVQGVQDPAEGVREEHEPVEERVKDSGLGVQRSGRSRREIPRLNPSTGQDYHVREKVQVRNSSSYAQAVKQIACKEFVHNLRVNDITRTRNLEYGLETGKVIACMIHDL